MGKVNCTYPADYLFILKNAPLEIIFVINIKYLVLSSLKAQNLKEKYSFI